MSRSLGGRSLTTLAPIEIVPELISSSPAIDRSAVDLPHPEGPTSTMNSPSPIRRSSSFTPAVPSGYTLLTRSRTISAIVLHLSASRAVRLRHSVMLSCYIFQVGIDAMHTRNRLIRNTPGKRQLGVLPFPSWN